MFNISYSKQKQIKTVINNQGFALLGIIITVFIISLIVYGVINISDKKTETTEGLEKIDVVTPQGQLKALNGAKTDIDMINQQTKERQLEN